MVVALMCAFGFETGIILDFTPESINSMAQSYLSVLSAGVESTNVPLIPFQHLGTDFLNVDFNITNLSFPEFNLDASKSGVAFKPNREVHFNLQEISMKSTFDWNLAKATFALSGSTDVLVTKASLLVNVSVSDSKDIKVVVNEATFTIEAFNITLSKEPYYSVVNWILDAVNKKAKETIETQLSSFFKIAIQNAFNDITPVTKIPVSSYVYFSIAHTHSPVMDSEHIKFQIEGVIIVEPYPYALTKPLEINYVIDKPIQVSVSDYTVNSFLYASFLSNKLAFKASDFEYKLNTNFLDSILPGISLQYGKNVDADVICNTIQSPIVNFTYYKGAVASLVLSCDLEIDSKGKVLELTFDLETLSSLWLEKWVVEGEFTRIAVNQVKFKESKLKNDPNTEGIKDLCNFTFGLLKSRVNRMVFGKGIPLPDILKLFFSEPEINIFEGYAVFEAFSNPRYR